MPNPLVHRVTIGAEGDVKKARTKLREILEQKEEMAAQRLSAAELETMAIQAENEASRLRGEPPVHKTAPDENGKVTAEQRKQLVESAKMLLDSGLDPKQVGQILLGLSPSSAAQIVGAGGMTVDDALAIVDRITVANKGSDVEATIARLEKRIEELQKGSGKVAASEVKMPDPVTYFKQQAEGIKTFCDILGIPYPGTAAKGTGGTNIEELKEKNRHDEKMEEVKTEREYKQGLNETLATIPENLGRGWAHHARESGASGSAGNDGFEHLRCADCGTDITITPKTGAQVTCPKCGSKYNRNQQALKNG